MHAMPAAFQPCQSNTSALVDADELLPRHPIFRTRDLEHAKEHIEGVFGEHRVAYMPKERQLDFDMQRALEEEMNRCRVGFFCSTDPVVPSQRLRFTRAQW